MNKLWMHSTTSPIALAIATTTTISLKGYYCYGDSVEVTLQEPKSKISATSSSSLLSSSTTFSTPSNFSPIPPIRIFQPNPRLEIAFDVRTRTPIYVMETLTAKSFDKDNNNRNNNKPGIVWMSPKRPRFYEEQQLQEMHRSRPHHYKHSGYDRGHLAPAADFPNQDDMTDTYSLCNVVPQYHSMNVTIWAKLEHWVRQVAKVEKESTTMVVTGPLWLPTEQIGEKKFLYSHVAIGHPQSLVSVPTHLFKVIAVIHSNMIIKFACFVIPNAEPNKEKSLQDYVVSWKDLENVSGLQFFPSLVDDEFLNASDYQTRKITQGRHQLLLTDGKILLGGQTSKTKIGKKDYRKLFHLCHDNACT